MSFVRTFGQLKPSKDVVGVAVKIQTEGLAKVTDVQLVAGSSLFSWSPMVGDLGLVVEPAWRYINGIIQEDYDTWVMTDEDVASPYRGLIYPIGAQNVEWGLLHLGEISEREIFDGHDYTTTTGAGVTPHLTARADQRLDLTTDGLMSVVVAVKGVHADVGSPPERTDDGIVTEAHPGDWGSVWAWHDTWTDVLAEHGGW